MVGTGGPVSTFSVWDYVVFAVTILGAASIGLFQAIRGRKEASSAEFLLGGRQIKAGPISNAPDTPSLIFGKSQPLAHLPAASRVLGTAFGPLYLELRFNRIIRLIGTSMYIVQTGGLKAVIWTDVLQMVIMLAGFIAVIARGAVIQGGLSTIWEDAGQGGPSFL
ncbi:hypothetical protein CRENBAI_006327 [Crenichthys baileyi]|uniref:Uncharacterized protein n=1 Tax=Crenichthys baileyi TaxID=28760 RepID=A0AAV9R643_9TELE